MAPVSARRALLRAVGRWGLKPAPADADGDRPPVFWGRVGAYEGVCREGILLLLAPEPVHPSLRVTAQPGA